MQYFSQLAAPNQTRKAYLGALIAILGGIATAYVDTDVGKIAAIIATGLTALVSIYGIPNDDTKPPVGPEPPL